MSNVNNKGGSHVPFMAFCSDEESTVLLKKFVTSKNWPESVIHSGDIDTAAQFLKTQVAPKVLFVDITTTADKVSASLDALADVCDPETKVIVSGKINEYSFYCWLVDVGISNYLLKPFNMQALEAAYLKATDVAAAAPKAEETKKQAKVITVIGARGGVGTTTVAVNMAWIIANKFQQKTALLDFDPQLGTVALALDLEPSKGLRDALEKPDRIDGLFIDRVMIRADDHLSVLSTEEPLDENIVAGEVAAESILKQCRAKYSYIVVDLPRVLTPFTRYAISNADHVVCVTEYTISGLREALRYLEYCRDHLKTKPPVIIANRVGLSGKHQMPHEEFERGLGRKVSFNIPFVLDVYAAATAGEVFAETAKELPAVKVLHQLSESFMEGTEKKPVQAAKNTNIFSLFKGNK